MKEKVVSLRRQKDYLTSAYRNRPDTLPEKGSLFTYYQELTSSVQEMDRIIEYTIHLILNALYDVAVDSTVDTSNSDLLFTVKVIPTGSHQTIYWFVGRSGGVHRVWLGSLDLFTKDLEIQGTFPEKHEEFFQTVKAQYVEELKEIKYQRAPWWERLINRQPKPDLDALEELTHQIHLFNTYVEDLRTYFTFYQQRGEHRLTDRLKDFFKEAPYVTIKEGD